MVPQALSEYGTGQVSGDYKWFVAVAIQGLLDFFGMPTALGSYHMCTRCTVQCFLSWLRCFRVERLVCSMLAQCPCSPKQVEVGGGALFGTVRQRTRNDSSCVCALVDVLRWQGFAVMRP